MEDIINLYGVGSMFAAGLIVDALHYFDENLWLACDSLLKKETPITGTREQVLLKKYWLDRGKKFAKNYFKGDLKKMVECLKDIHILHKWETICKKYKDIDLSKILTKPEYKDISDYGATACAGGACEVSYV